MSQLKIGLIGLGRAAQILHLPTLSRNRLFEIVAICDVSEAVLDGVGDLYKISARFTDYQSLLEHSNLDAVCITTPNHFQITCDALEVNIAVLVEKPLCWRIAQAEEIYKRANESEVPVLVGFMRRYLPALRQLRKYTLTADTQFARVHDFAGGLEHYHRQLPGICKPKDLDKGTIAIWEASIRAEIESELSGFPRQLQVAYRFLVDLGSHDLDMVLFLFGRPACVEASSIWFNNISSGFPEEWTVRTASDTGCCIIAILVFPSGMRLSLELAAFFNKDKPWDIRVDLFGVDGGAVLKFPFPFATNATADLKINTSNVGTTHSHPDYSDPFRVQHNRFAELLSSNKQSSTLTAAVDVLDLANAIMRSTDLGDRKEIVWTIKNES